jgi:hypothetical protein
MKTRSERDGQMSVPDEERSATDGGVGARLPVILAHVTGAEDRSGACSTGCAALASGSGC